MSPSEQLLTLHASWGRSADRDPQRILVASHDSDQNLPKQFQSARNPDGERLNRETSNRLLCHVKAKPRAKPLRQKTNFNGPVA